MSKPIPIVLTYDYWPQADKSAWDALFVSGGLFDDAGTCQHWSTGTRHKHAQGYGQWLSFLKRNTPDQLELAPAQRVTKECVEAYIKECELRLKARSVANLVSDLYVVAREFPGGSDLDWLNTASKRLTGRAKRQATHKTVEIAAGDIVKACLDQLETLLNTNHLSPLTIAIRHRQALMIAFLAARPVRRRALLAMTVSQHLRLVADGYEVRFAPEDMKDKKARSFPLPKTLVPHMTEYLDHHRPLLLGDRSSEALWINQYGNALSGDGLSRDFPRVTKRMFGIELRPHAFRHIVATSIAEQDPEHVGIIRDLLGHRTNEMADRYYNRATGISACDNYQTLIEDTWKNVQSGKHT